MANIIVRFGNSAPIQNRRIRNTDGTETPVRETLPGPVETIAHIPRAVFVDAETGAGIDGYTVGDSLKCITDSRGIWVNHSTANPTWVESTCEALEMFLASHYGCPRNAPT